MARTLARLRSCNDYLGLDTDDIETDDPADQGTLLGTLADCQTLRMLRDARSSARTFLDDFRLDAGALGALPADFYPDLSPDEAASLQTASRAGQTWQMFDPQVRMVEPRDARGRLRVQGDGYQADLDEVARGDFDRDGIEDLLIRRTARPTGGSLIDPTVFLLTRTRAGGRLTILQRWRPPG